jgi:uncharacterized membrane protein YccF (DUF307 family)
MNEYRSLVAVVVIFSFSLTAVFLRLPLFSMLPSETETLKRRQVESEIYRFLISTTIDLLVNRVRHLRCRS